VFLKCEADARGTLRGRRQLMLDDSDVHHHRQIKGAVGGVTAATVGDPAVFVSVGALHQGPAQGGGPVAAIVRAGLSRGASTRMTSAPKDARKRPATGPAITRERSRTRTPSSAVPAPSGRGGADRAPVVVSTTGRVRTAWCCGWARYCDRVRMRAATPPASLTAASRSPADQRATAAATAVRSASTPSTASAASRCGARLVCSRIHPSAVA
jgi:hypothetical protein